ncbi:hypothetical protein D3C86_1251250 [compost metagenome]
MKTNHRIFFCATLIAGSMASQLWLPREVLASPQPSRISISGFPPSAVGVDADLGVPLTPLRVGGLVQLKFPSDPSPNDPTISVWSGVTVFQDSSSALDLLVGGNYFVEPGIATLLTLDSAPAQSRYGVLVAASYLVSAPRLWLRLTPQYVFPVDARAYYPGYMKSGIPLVEVGVKILPQLSLSLGASVTPLRMTWSL